MIEAIFAGSVLLAERSHRGPALLLFGDELPPEVQPRRLCLRHAASIGDRPRHAKWCLSDAYCNPIGWDTFRIEELGVGCTGLKSGDYGDARPHFIRQFLDRLQDSWRQWSWFRDRSRTSGIVTATAGSSTTLTN